MSKFFQPSQIIDLSNALKISRDWIGSLSKEKQKAIPQYIEALFTLWKAEEGIPCFGIRSGLLATPQPKLTNKERLYHILGLEPWDCVPAGVPPNRIGLLDYMLTEKYKKIPYTTYLDCLAHLIIEEINKGSTDPYLAEKAMILSKLNSDIEAEIFQKIYLPKINRDDRRQEGTKKEKKPEITKWLTKKLQHNPSAKCPELWLDAPGYITDNISIDRFKKRVTKVKKELKSAASK